MDEKMKETMKGIYDSLTDEQKEQAKTCKNMDDFMKLAGEWGIELPDELADAVAGGIDYMSWWQRLVLTKDSDEESNYRP